MNYASVSIAFLSAITICALVLRARHNHKLKDTLGAMTENELLQESFWEAQRGNYNSVYSRELARRKNCLEAGAEADLESVALNQL